MLTISDLCVPWVNQTIWPPSSEKIVKCHLKAGVYPNEIQTFNGQAYICSSQYEIFAYVINNLRCSLTLIRCDENFGGALINGSFNGILKYIADKSIDFVPHEFSFTTDRARILDFEFSFPQGHSICILSYRKKFQSNDPFKIFYSFEWRIWLLILIFFLCMGWIFFLIKLMTGTIPNNNSWTLQQIFHGYLHLYTLTLGQSLHDWPHHRIRSDYHLDSDRNHVKSAQQILRYSLFLWVFCALILRWLISIDVVAFLLSTSEEKIDSFNQIKVGSAYADYRLFVEKASSTERLFLRKFPEMKHRIIRIDYDQVSGLSVISKLVNEKYFMISGRSRAKAITDYYNNMDFQVSQEGFFSLLGNFAIRKNMDLKPKQLLINLSKILYSSGIYTKLRQKTILLNLLRVRLKLNSGDPGKLYLNQGNLDEDIDPDDNQLMQNQTSQIIHHRSASFVYSIINLYLIGIVFSTICFVIECIRFSFQKVSPFKKRLKIKNSISMFSIPSGKTIFSEKHYNSHLVHPRSNVTC